MLSDFLKLIQDTAVKAAGASVVNLPNDSRRCLVVHDGKMERIELESPNRDHSLLSIASLCELSSLHEGGSVWHSDKQVTLVLDNDDRREFAAVKLDKSAPFARLVSISQGDSGGKVFTQQQLVRLLRHDLRNAGVEHVLSAIRRIEFKRTGATKGVVEHGRESMGKAVEAEVQGAENVPESFTATVPVYSTPGADWHKSVYCTLEIDMANERFVILPDADSLSQAIHAAQADLQNELQGEVGDIPVYYGAP